MSFNGIKLDKEEVEQLHNDKCPECRNPLSPFVQNKTVIFHQLSQREATLYSRYCTRCLTPVVTFNCGEFRYSWFLTDENLLDNDRMCCHKVDKSGKKYESHIAFYLFTIDDNERVRILNSISEYIEKNIDKKKTCITIIDFEFGHHILPVEFSPLWSWADNVFVLPDEVFHYGSDTPSWLAENIVKKWSLKNGVKEVVTIYPPLSNFHYIFTYWEEFPNVNLSNMIDVEYFTEEMPAIESMYRNFIIGVNVDE